MDKINKTEWKIYINGDKNYIEDLILTFNKLNLEPLELFIYKENEDYLLDSKRFDNIDDAKKLSEKAKTFLTTISTISPFKRLRDLEPLKIEKFIKTSEDKKLEEVYDPEGNLIRETEITKDGKKSTFTYTGSIKINLSIHSPTVVTTKNGRIIFSLNTIEAIKSQIINSKDDNENLNKLSEYLNSILEKLLVFTTNFSEDEKIKKIIEILNNPETTKSDSETLRWVNLYKIYEIIEKDMGSESKLKNKKWVDVKDIDNFKKTANNHRHSIYKIFNNPPKQRMNLYKGEEFISILLSKYIEEKIKTSSNLNEQ